MMKARYARRIRSAIWVARGNFLWGSKTLNPHDAAQFWYPYENPFCRLQHEAFVRTYRALQNEAA